MNRDDVIRMAREIGLEGPMKSGILVFMDDLERFVALVAAAEREACAEICDRVALRYGEGPEVEHWAQGFKKGASVSAAKIRERGKE